MIHLCRNRKCPGDLPWEPARPPGYFAGSAARVAVALFCVLLSAWPNRREAQAYEQWEIDWDAVFNAGFAIADQISESPLARYLEEWTSGLEIDWQLVGRLVDRVLKDSSWEDAAALLPYAERAVAHFASREETGFTADWLQQRIDYLRVARHYVDQARAPEPVSPPAKPEQIPTKPEKPAPVRPTIDKDMLLWSQRLPPEPPSRSTHLVGPLKSVFVREGLSPAFVWIAEVESAFNPRARSPAGAAGLYQFMPATATRFGLSLEPEDQRYDPERSAQAAARYLRYLYGLYSDWPLALAAYNAGEGRVSRALNRRSGGTFADIAGHLPVETRMYVPRVLAVIERREGIHAAALPPPAPSG